MTQTVNDSVYLVVGLKNPRYPNSGLKIRASKRANSLTLKSGEVLLRVGLNVPVSLFNKPTLSATISVPEDAVSAPVIEAEVLENITEIIKEQLDIDVNIQVVEAI